MHNNYTYVLDGQILIPTLYTYQARLVSFVHEVCLYVYAATYMRVSL